MINLRTLLFVILILCFTSAVLAQVDCPTIVENALVAVDSACSGTARNQVCYGNIQLTATPRARSELTFSQAGDMANVMDLQTLRLSSMSLTDSSWGVALMQIQANLPDTLPGQNVIFLLFGNVQIDNEGEAPLDMTMTASQGVNVRLRPTTTANNIIASLKAGEVVSANGRLPDSSWLRVKVDGVEGWVSANFLTTTNDVNNLAVVEAGVPVFGPMQAFSFSSGLGDRPCAEAPDSGILIRTPEGSGKITLNINDVQIQLGSTVYLQAQPNNQMTISVVEGQAILEVANQSQIVPAGTYSQVQLDAAGKGIGAPSLPQPYNAQTLQTLPLNLKVFASVKVAVPLTMAQIATALATPSTQIVEAPPNNGDTVVVSSASPQSGIWVQHELLSVNTCDPTGTNIPGTRHSWNNTLIFNGDSLTTENGPQGQTATLGRIGDNVYQGVFDYNHLTITFTFTSATTYTYKWSGIYPEFNGTPACDYIIDATGEYLG